jgi:hypothetical protein
MANRHSARFARSGALLASALAALLVVGCGGQSTEYSYPNKQPGGKIDPTGSNKKYDSVLGEGGGFNFLGRSAKTDEGGTGIGVNSFLWRASLDSIAFMPLASADPFGGVIITDWFSPPETPDERFKLNIYILDRQLRADGVKAAVFRQRRDPSGGWIDAAVEAKTTIELENAILTRARQLRIAAARP